MPEATPHDPAAGAKLSIEATSPIALPAWADRLADLYYSGTISAFVLHGNVQDHVEGNPDGPQPYGSLIDFLAERVFGSWDLVLHYDLARGLRAFAGSNGESLKEMVVLANRRVGDLAAARRDPAIALRERL